MALFVALAGGTAFAASHLAKRSVGTKQLKRNAVVSSRVKNGSLQSNDFAAGQLPAVTQGPPGPRGPQGDTGATGPQGDTGPSDGYTASGTKSCGSAYCIDLSLPAGSYILTANAHARYDQGTGTMAMDCTLSEVGRATIDSAGTAVPSPSAASAALVGGVTFSSPSTIRAQCTMAFRDTSSYSYHYPQFSIAAVRVGTLHTS